MRIAPDKEQQITEIVQMLHNASLMYVSLCVVCVCVLDCLCQTRHPAPSVYAVLMT